MLQDDFVSSSSSSADLKVTPSEDASWPENVETVQTYYGCSMNIHATETPFLLQGAAMSGPSLPIIVS